MHACFVCGNLTSVASDTGKYDPGDAHGPDSAEYTVVEGAHTHTDWMAIHHVIQTVDDR